MSAWPVITIPKTERERRKTKAERQRQKEKRKCVDGFAGYEGFYLFQKKRKNNVLAGHRGGATGMPWFAFSLIGLVYNRVWPTRDILEGTLAQ